MKRIAESFAFYPRENYSENLSSDSKFSFNEIVSNDKSLFIRYVYYPIENSKYTILYSHGNAEDLSTLIDNYFLTCQLAEITKCSVVAYDYPGYGQTRLVTDKFGTNTAKPSERGCYECITSIYDSLLRKQFNLEPNQIISFGKSIGTGPALYLSTNRKVFRTILQSPFKSAIKVVTNFPFLNLFDIFKNQDRIENISSPILIIHAKDDQVIPFDHSEKLMSQLLLNDSTKDIAFFYPIEANENCGHNCIESNNIDYTHFPFSNKYYLKLKEFIEKKIEFSEKTNEKKEFENCFILTSFLR